MPPLTRLAIRLALAWLVAGLGGLALRPVGGALLPSPTLYHLLTVGWLTQLIVGVAYWMFPRESAARPRGRAAPAWAAVLGLNAGLLLRLAAEPVARVHGPAPVTAGALAASALLQLAAAIAFAVHLWPRVRARA